MKNTRLKADSKPIVITRFLAAALLLLGGAVAGRAQNFSGSDSLTETTENTTDWKTPDSGVQGGSTFTDTTSGLQYTDLSHHPSINSIEPPLDFP